MKTRNSQKCALVIEDSEILINFYKSTLAKYNCTVDLAFTVQHAKDKIAANKNYDLYIIDKSLPDGDATELIGNGIDPKKSLIISAYLNRDTDVDQIAAEFNMSKSHIQHKPIIEEDLDELIQEIFGKQSVFHLDVSEIFNSSLNFIYIKLKKMTLKHFAFTIGFMIFLGVFFPTLETWKYHQIHDEFHMKIENYSTQEFKNFHPNGKVTENTYIEHTEKIGEYTFRVRLYPRNFVHILVTSPEYGTQEIWLSDEAFLKLQGIDHDDDFVNIFMKTWKKTFKMLIGSPT